MQHLRPVLLLQVNQFAAVAPLEQQLAVLKGIIQRHKAENPDDYKVSPSFSMLCWAADLHFMLSSSSRNYKLQPRHADSRSRACFRKAAHTRRC